MTVWLRDPIGITASPHPPSPKAKTIAREAVIPMGTLSRQLVLAVHDIQLREHGGASGIRDEGLLESALARPLNRAGYGDPDTVELAAVYAIAIARNHPFIDGNKRTAYVAMVLFLALNGIAFVPDQADAVITTMTMAAGEFPDEAFVDWVRGYTVPKG